MAGLLGLTCLLAAARLEATAQIPDVIVLDGVSYSLTVNPLKEFFAKHPDKQPNATIRSSENWRDYVAEFAVVEGALVVTDMRVTTDFNGGDESVLTDVLPGGGAVRLSSFTGHLIVPLGEPLRYVHMGYSPEFDHYIAVRVGDGVTGMPMHFNRRGFAKWRQTQLAAFKLTFKRTTDYRDAIEELRRAGPTMNTAEVNAFLQEFMPLSTPRAEASYANETLTRTSTPASVATSLAHCERVPPELGRWDGLWPGLLRSWRMPPLTRCQPRER